MIKYTGPRVRIARRFGFLPGLTRKYSKQTPLTPGEHGKMPRPQLLKRVSISDNFKRKLLEKQRARFNYGISERQFFGYYKQIKTQKGEKSKGFSEFLESRLDCIVFRLGFAKTILAARQLINHGHILVNKRLVTIPSFACTTGDIISAKDSKKSRLLIGNCLKKIEEDRLLVLERLKEVKKTHKDFVHRSTKLLPKHLKLNVNALEGVFCDEIDRNEALLSIQESRVLEFYSI